MGNDFGMGGLATGFIFLLCFFPLAIWKLVDIIIWLFQHIRIDW